MLHFLINTIPELSLERKKYFKYQEIRAKKLFELQINLLIKYLFQVLTLPCSKITEKAKHKGKSKECLSSFQNDALFIAKPGRELFSGWKMLGWEACMVPLFHFLGD